MCSFVRLFGRQSLASSSLVSLDLVLSPVRCFSWLGGCSPSLSLQAFTHFLFFFISRLECFVQYFSKANHSHCEKSLWGLDVDTVFIFKITSFSQKVKAFLYVFGWQNSESLQFLGRFLMWTGSSSKTWELTVTSVEIIRKLSPLVKERRSMYVFLEQWFPACSTQTPNSLQRIIRWSMLVLSVWYKLPPIEQKQVKVSGITILNISPRSAASMQLVKWSLDVKSWKPLFQNTKLVFV